MEEQDRLLI